jgi:hypothetical protein
MKAVMCRGDFRACARDEESSYDTQLRLGILAPRTRLGLHPSSILQPSSITSFRNESIAGRPPKLPLEELAPCPSLQAS